MIEKNSFMPINFFKKTDYKGSLSGLRYRIGKADVQEETVLRAIIWEGPFAYEKRDPATEYSKDFSFDEEGIGAAVDWINGEYERDRERWDNVPFWTPQMSRKWESANTESVNTESAGTGNA